MLGIISGVGILAVSQEKKFCVNIACADDQGPLLLTWINFNPSRPVDCVNVREDNDSIVKGFDFTVYMEHLYLKKDC